MARLTTTSYAVLALLARRPYSAYDLTAEIKASLSQCLPRSATLLYREPKNLVAQGLAEAEIHLRGRQKRAVYTITAAGRGALEEWFTQPPAAPVFESEAVARIVFGHLGRREDLVATLKTLEAQVVEQTGSPPAAEDLHDRAVVAELYTQYYALLINWSRWAREQIEPRPDSQRD